MNQRLALKQRGKRQTLENCSRDSRRREIQNKQARNPAKLRTKLTNQRVSKENRNARIPAKGTRMPTRVVEYSMEKLKQYSLSTGKKSSKKTKKNSKLLRECIGYIKENEKAWKREEEEKLTERQKKEQRNKLKQAEKKQKEKETAKQVQNKITETWKRIPEHERRHLLKEEEKRRRMELREVKINI